jgi:hypothetical protein
MFGECLRQYRELLLKKIKTKMQRYSVIVVMEAVLCIVGYSGGWQWHPEPKEKSESSKTAAEVRCIPVAKISC